MPWRRLLALHRAPRIRVRNFLARSLVQHSLRKRHDNQNSEIPNSRAIKSKEMSMRMRIIGDFLFWALLIPVLYAAAECLYYMHKYFTPAIKAFFAQ